MQQVPYGAQPQQDWLLPCLQDAHEFLNYLLNQAAEILEGEVKVSTGCCRRENRLLGAQGPL